MGWSIRTYYVSSEAHLRENGKLNSSYIYRKPELRDVFAALENRFDSYILHPLDVVPRGLLGVDDAWNRSKNGQVRCASSLIATC